MLKFLRKYDKWILAVGGSLLMVAFLLPQALQQMGRGGNDRVVATYANGEITAAERYAANARLNFLRNAAGPVLQQLGVDDEDHWIMLLSEAERGGFLGGPETGRAYFANLARLQGVDPDQTLPMVLAVTGMSEQAALTAYAELSAIDRMRIVHLQVERVSMPEALRQHYLTTPTVGLHAGYLPAEHFLENVTRIPLEDELLAFYNERRDRPRGAGRLDFGYRVESAVKFEWIDLAPEVLERAIELDPVEVNTRWRRMHDTIYTGEFAEERERVEEDMRREIVSRVMGDAQTVVLSSISRAERDGSEIDLQEIAESIRTTTRERSGIELPEIPFDQRDERWYTRTDVQSTPRVRNARLQGGTPAGFPQVAMGVRELDPSDPYDVGVGEIIGPLRSTSGSLIYARVTDARPAGSPESIESVREQVVADFRLQRAWEMLQERAERFPAQVAARGVATVVTDNGGAFVAGLRATPQRLVRPETRSINEEVFARVNDPEFASEVMGTASGIDPIGDVRDLPADGRVSVVSLPEKAIVAIGEIVSVDPVTMTSFRSGVRQAISTIEQRRYPLIFGGGPYTFDRMKERLNYEAQGTREDEELAESLADEAGETESSESS